MARIRGCSHFSIAWNVRSYFEDFFEPQRAQRAQREKEGSSQIMGELAYYSRTSRTDFGNNLSLNQTTFAGTSFTLTPAFSKFSRSEIAKIKLSHPDLCTWANFFCKYSGRQ